MPAQEAYLAGIGKLLARKARGAIEEAGKTFETPRGTVERRAAMAEKVRQLPPFLMGRPPPKSPSEATMPEPKDWVSGVETKPKPIFTFHSGPQPPPAATTTSALSGAPPVTGAPSPAPRLTTESGATPEPLPVSTGGPSPRIVSMRPDEIMQGFLDAVPRGKWPMYSLYKQAMQQAVERGMAFISKVKEAQLSGESPPSYLDQRRALAEDALAAQRQEETRWVAPKALAGISSDISQMGLRGVQAADIEDQMRRRGQWTPADISRLASGTFLSSPKQIPELVSSLRQTGLMDGQTGAPPPAMPPQGAAPTIEPPLVAALRAKTQGFTPEELVATMNDPAISPEMKAAIQTLIAERGG